MPRAKVKTKRFAMRVAPAVLDEIDREAAAAKLTRTQYLIDGRSIMKLRQIWRENFGRLLNADPPPRK